MKKLSFVLFLSLLIGCLFVSCNSKNSTDLSKLTSKSREVVQAFSTEKKDVKVTMGKKTEEAVKELLSSVQAFERTENVTIMSTDGIVELGDLGYTLAGDFSDYYKTLDSPSETKCVLKETQTGKKKNLKFEIWNKGSILEFGDFKYSYIRNSDGELDEVLNGRTIDRTYDWSDAELEAYHEINQIRPAILTFNKWIFRSGTLKIYLARIDRDPSNDANILKTIAAYTETDDTMETVFTIYAEVDGHTLKVRGYSDASGSPLLFSSFGSYLNSTRIFWVDYLLSDDFWSAKGKKGLEILSFEYDGTAYDVTH